jgi:hypothetical protein
VNAGIGTSGTGDFYRFLQQRRKRLFEFARDAAYGRLKLKAEKTRAVIFNGSANRRR